MNPARILCVLLLTSTCWSVPGEMNVQAVHSIVSGDHEPSPSARIPDLAMESLATIRHASAKHSAVDQPTGAGVKEEIPAKYLKRYQDWKNEFLATETGRRQWEIYAESPQFTLTITVSHDNRNGGGTSKYKWDDAGRLISATITLGCRMDEGYPGPVYYPVMNSLAPRQFSPGIGGSVLAATKLAHEFGHVSRMAGTDSVLGVLGASAVN